MEREWSWVVEYDVVDSMFLLNFDIDGVVFFEIEDFLFVVAGNKDGFFF